MSDEKAQAGQQEPSMEDILASIRRILSEDGDERSSSEDSDEAAPPPPAAASNAASKAAQAMPEEAPNQAQPAAGPGVAAPPSPEVEDPAPSDPAPGGSVVPEFEPRAEVAGEPEIELEDVLELTPDMRVGPVISQPTAAASSDVLSQLAKAILSRRDIAIGNRDVTLESMVREMLRPLLKEWLDRNLPYLIERLVKKEIDLMINRAERLED